VRFFVFASAVVLAAACGSSSEDGGTAPAKDAGLDSGSGGGGFLDGAGWLDSGTGGVIEAGPTCSNQQKDPDETGVDCGGPCTPCGIGSGCNGPDDCLSYTCIGNLCCTLETYTLETGPISPAGDICCNGTDPRLSYADCGVGSDHLASPVEPNCAHAASGEFNEGYACAKVVCQTTSCGVTGDR
jgi:hypothetical protein